MYEDGYFYFLLLFIHISSSFCSPVFLMLQIYLVLHVIKTFHRYDFLKVFYNVIHEMKYRTTIENFRDKDFVFQCKNGYPFATKNITDRMRRIMRFIEIEKKLTP